MRDIRRYSNEQHLRLMRRKKADFWRKEENKMALEIFHEAAKRVPAYRDFLKKNDINPAKVKTRVDLALVPAIDKRNYLRQYPTEKLCWDGTLKKPLVWTSTSGSTGEPFYFPRSQEIDFQSSIIHQLFFESASKNVKGPILILNCFGMGVWIGGLITYQAFRIIQEKGVPVSILSPGINKGEIFHALRKLSPHFNQTIIIGYPPFVKSIIDEAKEHKILLQKLNIRFIFAAETFTEKFRDYISKKTRINNLLVDTMNIYGSADIGSMAFETPLSIFIRRVALKKPALFKEIFGSIERTPTLVQYNPMFISFETDKNGEVLLSGNSALPLIRYAIGDHGGVFSFYDLVKKFRIHGINLEKSAQKAGLGKFIYQMPFVYIYERSDFSTKLYGAIIHPEPIREALQNEKLEKFITGKFAMITQFDKKQNEFMEIHIEMRSKSTINPKIKKLCQELIVENLLLKNAEYRNNYHSFPRRVIPKLIFWRHEHPLHFKPGIKQKWTKK